MDKEYIIVGDAGSLKGCLVSLVWGGRENAEKKLYRMLHDPTPNDLDSMKGHTNLRIEEAPKKDCWWNDPKLVK